MNAINVFSGITVREAAVIITGSLGLLFMLISLIGIIRLPDFFTRLHAQGVGDTLGALLLIISMMTAAGAGLMSVKLFLVIAIILITNPVGTNLMMIAGMNNKEYREYKKDRKHRKENKADDADN
jgi:multicomponent Na+:H+ antiporter subunit G